MTARVGTGTGGQRALAAGRWALGAGRWALGGAGVTLALVDREPGEEIFFHGHPSWLSMTGAYVKALLLALLVGVLAGVASVVADRHVEVLWVVAGVAVAFGLPFCMAQLRRVQTTYAITSRRLAIETGLLSRDLHQTRLERVQNVNARQSLLERALGIGTVDFDTAGEARFDFSFRGVDDPRQIVRTVDRAIHQLGYGSERQPV